MNQFLKGVIWVCIGIVPFLAWLVADSLFFPFITGKNFLFRVLVEIAFASWLILALRDASYRLKHSLMTYVYLGFMIVIGIADYLGVDGYTSFWSNYERMEGYITHIHLFAYFIVLFAFLKGEKSWTRLMGLFVAANVPVLIEGFMQLLGRPEFIFHKISPTLQDTFHTVYSVHMSDSLRLDSSLGNAAYYGIYTLFNFIFALVLIVKAENLTKGKSLTEKIKYNFRGGLGLLTLVAASLLVLSSVYASYKGNVTLGPVLDILGIISLLTAVYYFAKNYNNGQIGRGVLVLIAIMNLIQLYYTQTRGSYLGLVGGVIVAVLFYTIAKLKKKINKKVDSNMMAGLTLGLSVIAIVAIVYGALYSGASYIAANKDSSLVQNNVFLKRLATINIINPVTGFKLVQDESLTYEDLNKYFGDITIVSRFLNAKIAVQGWHDRPWFGFGQENYKNVFDKYFDPRMYSQEAWFDRTHDVFFDWLVAGGALGLGFYLALYLTPYYIMWIGRGRDQFHLIEKSAISGLLVGYFIHNIFVFDNLISYILFFMILAYVAAKGSVLQDTIVKANDINTIFWKKLKVTEKIEIALSGIIIIVMCIMLYLVNWLPYSSNKSISLGLQYKQMIQYYMQNNANPKNFFDEAQKTFSFALNNNNFGKQEALEQYLTTSSDLFVTQGGDKAAQTEINNAKLILANDAFSRMDNYVASTTLTARSLTIYAGALAQLHLYDKALTIIDKALVETPKKQILLNFRTQLLNASNRKDEAYQNAKKSYLLDTSFKTSEDLYYQIAAESKNGKDFELTIKKIKKVAVLPYDEKYIAVYVQSKMYDEAKAMIANQRKVATSTTDIARLKQIEIEMYKSMSAK